MATAQRPVTGPNDFHLVAGNIEPGLGEELENEIRSRRGMHVVDEPPAKAELRKQAAELATRAKNLSVVERELEKERTRMEEEFAEKLAAVEAREAVAAATLRDLGKE